MSLIRMPDTLGLDLGFLILDRGILSVYIYGYQTPDARYY